MARVELSPAANTFVFVQPIGLSDDKGREIGIEIRTYETDATEVKDGDRGYYVMEPGHKYVAAVGCARNGVGFGATQRRHYFATSAERLAYIEKRSADIIKSQSKKWRK